MESSILIQIQQLSEQAEKETTMLGKLSKYQLMHDIISCKLLSELAKESRVIHDNQLNGNLHRLLEK